MFTRDFSGSLVVKTLLPLQGAQVQTLVGEQRSHILHNAAKKKKKKKIYVDQITHCPSWDMLRMSRAISNTLE